MTGGATTVTVLPGGALGDERANLQQLGSGSIDLALTGDLVISFMAQPYMLVSMPFIYDSPEHSIAVFNGEIGNEINQYLHDNHGIQALGWQYVGTRVLTANKPIRNLEELRGLKTRLPGAQMWVMTWEKKPASRSPATPSPNSTSPCRRGQSRPRRTRPTSSALRSFMRCSAM